jgi:hypothetical protein
MASMGWFFRVLMASCTTCQYGVLFLILLVFDFSGVEEELFLGAEETCLYTWQDALGKREFHWHCREHKGKNDLIKDDGGDFFADSDTKIYWITFLDGLQRVMLLTQDQSLLKAAREVRLMQN